MNSEIFKIKDWIKIWSGKWSLHFASHQGYWWTKNNSIGRKSVFNKVVYFSGNGITDCWVSSKDKDNIGARLRMLALNDPLYISNIAEGLISYGKKVKAFTISHNPKDFGLKEFNQFWDIYGDYFVYHVAVKYIVDYLPNELLKKSLPQLEVARLSSESVTRDAENYLEMIAEQFAAKNSYTKEMILSTTREELKLFLQGKSLPNQLELQNRYKKSSLVFDAKGYEVYTGKKVATIKKIIPSIESASVIKGQIAYQGLAKGVVKIIFDPLKESINFKKGDILVTNMTRPEFLPIMLKSSAIITDDGGILSHAAITAREMKKPCVIGTKIATKVLKDGDSVEVDANRGTVQKLKDAKRSVVRR